MPLVLPLATELTEEAIYLRAACHLTVRGKILPQSGHALIADVL
jgi:hypothetical protein